MAIIEGGEPKVLENKEGNRTTPSIVAVSKNGERLVGQLAKRQSITNPKNTIYSIKRFIGRHFDDDETKRDKNNLPYEILKSGDGIKVKMGDNQYTPQEISAMILQKLKADAEAKLGETITEAVITVPAYFNDSQRQATKDAGEIAGLKVRRIINEPTAAALAYGFNSKKDEKIVVYDLGGGTFDVSVLEVGSDTVEVRATNGDTHLGGDDFDQLVMDWILDEFKKESGIDLRKDPMALQRIKESAEKSKIELSTSQETEINQPFIGQDSSGSPVHLVLKLTRSKLETICNDLAYKTLEPCKKALADANLKIEEINEVVLVGGMTRMPLIQKLVQEYFHKKPNVSLNPDEVVAVGAAVQAGVLQGDVKDVLLLDVTPLSLGIETLGGVATKLIERNTTIPTSKTQVFSTAGDNQTQVEIHVVQGERQMANDNKTLGRFQLVGIPPSPRGVPQIEVKFDIDANGILKVSATDKATNKSQNITITASSGLSDTEIEKMKKDAEIHAEEDKQKLELVESKNNAETLLFTTEKSLKESGDKITEDLKKEINEKVENLKKVKDGNDIILIKSATDELSSSLQKIGQAMYKNENNSQTETDASNSTNSTNDNVKQEKKDGEDVVEGEVVK